MVRVYLALYKGKAAINIPRDVVKPLVLQRMVRICNRLHQPAPVHPRRIGGYH